MVLALNRCNVYKYNNEQPRYRYAVSSLLDTAYMLPEQRNFKVESKEDLKKEEELNEALESDSNTLPPNYTASDEETDSDMDYTARSGAKVEELYNTCKRNV
uniref:Uncharacterized protein n=1 Tax=Tanacetum cinerariifolium TaxID=118510 RepID=A0A6L2J407_TANCI|nr:hypothetical protein [Tanacetum cinerariifolium]